jgi:5-methylcytosine-specific restriction protein A
METDTRAQVWAKTQGHCWYCGKLMNPWNDCTIDHMDPKKQGGNDALGNLIPACKSCNSRKSAKTVEEYRAYLLDQKRQKFWGEHALRILAPPGDDVEGLRKDIARLTRQHDTDVHLLTSYWQTASIALGLLGSPMPRQHALTLLTLLMEADYAVPKWEHPTSRSLSFRGGLTEEMELSLPDLARKTGQRVTTTLACLLALESWNFIHLYKVTDIAPDSGFDGLSYSIESGEVAVLLASFQKPPASSSGHHA